MREIKFRAWDKKSQKIYQITDINFSDYVANGVCCGNWKEFSINNLLQYTGLKDKNGVEIYEGDIVVYEFNKLNYRIEFMNAEFIARRFYQNIENLYPTEFNYGKECEVIGNIYENPELLEKTGN